MQTLSSLPYQTHQDRSNLYLVHQASEDQTDLPVLAFRRSLQYLQCLEHHRYLHHAFLRSSLHPHQFHYPAVHQSFHHYHCQHHHKADQGSLKTYIQNNLELFQKHLIGYPRPSSTPYLDHDQRKKDHRPSLWDRQYADHPTYQRSHH